MKLFPNLNFPGLGQGSFGIENTKQDVDSLIQVLEKIAKQPHVSKKTDLQKNRKKISSFLQLREYMLNPGRILFDFPFNLSSN